jgi:hypothetical protein
MSTVFTPEAVARMVAKGTFRKVKLADLAKTDCDEVFYFKFPSDSMMNEVNGDGDWLEVMDYAKKLDWIDTNAGTIETTPETEVYVR